MQPFVRGVWGYSTSEAGQLGVTDLTINSVFHEAVLQDKLRLFVQKLKLKHKWTL